MRNHRGFFIILILTILSNTLINPIFAAAIKPQNVSIELIAEDEIIEPGNSFWMGILFNMDPEWHIYWKNPGESGLPVSVEWDLPEGFTVSDLHWPAPEKMNLLGMTSFAYSEQVMLLAQITPNETISTSNIEIAATVSWLECNDTCIPAEARVKEFLKIGDYTYQSKQISHLFETARSRVPNQLNEWNGNALLNKAEKSILIQLQATDFDSLDKLRNIYFFPEDSFIDITEDPEISYTTNGVNISLKIYDFIDDQFPASISGILKTIDSWHSTIDAEYMQIDIPLTETSIPLSGALVITDKENSFNVSRALIFAFIGGLILNLMPCVFPIIGIKIMDFVKKAHDSRLKIILHGLTFTLGVLLSFWVLSGTLLILRAGGEHIGWGFQLQSPLFIAFLALLLFIMSLNFLGVFEIGTGLISSGSKLTKSNNYSNSFFTGVLATVVATPCTAPFMGAALGFALTQTNWTAMQIFTALGLGMSTPYLLLSIFPGFLKKLPRPGQWMVTLKKLMAIPLIATVAWLIWIFTRQTNTQSLLQLIISLTLIALACWIYGKWGSILNNKNTRTKAITTAVILALISLLCILKTDTPSDDTKATYREKHGVVWYAFTPTIVKELQAAGRPVFLDFTADWCLTCQFNANVVFSSDEVINKFHELGVIFVEADWTRRDPIITQELEKHGRSGVPFYLIYTKDPEQEPIVLPPILTPEIVLKHLELMEKVSQ